MNQKKSPKKWLAGIIIIVVLLAMVIGFFLLYAKIKRIETSVRDAAQKATSQNTPLAD